MEELFTDLLATIKKMSHLRNRIQLAKTPQGAKDLFIMACWADHFDALHRYGYDGKLTNEVVQGFYEFMKEHKVG